MKKIGIITGNLRQHQTGLGTYTFHILKGIRDTYSVDQIMDSDGELLDGCNKIIPKKVPAPYNYLTWSMSLSLQKKIFDKYDIIHNTSQLPVYPSDSKRSVITIHDLIPILYPSLVTPVYAWQSKILLPRILKKTSRIIAVSNQTKKDLVHRYQLNPEKIDVIYEGVSDFFYPRNAVEVKEFREKVGLEEPYILFVGALEPKKNIPGILRAFSHCLKESPHLKLVLAGKLSWKYDDIMQTIKALKISDNVKFMNFIPYNDLPLLYTGAETFVFPSWYEGFGLPPLEAMKCGTPTIVSDRSSLPEIAGPRGVIVAPDNDIELSEKILSLISNSSYRAEQSRYCLERSSFFSWDNCIKRTKELYEKISS